MYSISMEVVISLYGGVANGSGTSARGGLAVETTSKALDNVSVAAKCDGGRKFTVFKDRLGRYADCVGTERITAITVEWRRTQSLVDEQRNPINSRMASYFW